MAAVGADLPTWDMSPFFPGLDSKEFQQELEHAREALDRIARLEDELHVDKGAGEHRIPIGSFEGLLHDLNVAIERVVFLRSYVSAFTTTDSRNELAMARSSELDKLTSALNKLLKRFNAWAGTSDVEELIHQSSDAAAHELFLRKAKVLAEHLMSLELEALVSDLETTGSSAWRNLYKSLTSQIVVPVTVHGEPRTLPMSAVRALATDPDRAVRKAAYEAELAAWKGNETVVSACMNSIKGETLLLSKSRGWDSPLDGALFTANIDRQTLDAMLASMRRSFPDFRRYMGLKAKALGIQKLAFFDLFAPLPGVERSWSYSAAESFVAEQFDAYSERLSEFARRAFRERWIDVGPREGKVDGAYCMHVRNGDSRVLMNFKPAFPSVSTLAHELGHGFHNLCLKGRTPLQRQNPMTLAETASIFCETVIRRAVLRDGSPEERLIVLEATLQGSCQIVVDIFSRFLFESRMFEAREKREVSASEMCSLMLDSQRETYGDGLDPELLHPYMWAAKPHYYGSSFYNFPYAFGLLFGLGLYAVYEQEGEPFTTRYEELLSSTGLYDAATLASRFGIDIRSEAFWDASLGQIREDVDLFESTIQKRCESL